MFFRRFFIKKDSMIMIIHFEGVIGDVKKKDLQEDYCQNFKRTNLVNFLKKTLRSEYCTCPQKQRKCKNLRRINNVMYSWAFIMGSLKNMYTFFWYIYVLFEIIFILRQKSFIRKENLSVYMSPFHVHFRIHPVFGECFILQK